MVYEIRMGNRIFIANHKQWNELQALAYWISEKYYCLERYGETTDGSERAHKTITKCIFPQLDKIGVPFWVQNRVIIWAEDWRRTSSTYLYQAFEAPGYSFRTLKEESEVKTA